MKYDTFVSLTVALEDEFYRQSHGGQPSALWLMQDRSVVALCPSWPLPDDALVMILSAETLETWFGPEYNGEPFTHEGARETAQDWMSNNGDIAIWDAEDMAAIMAEQEAAWTLYEKGETCQS